MCIYIYDLCNLYFQLSLQVTSTKSDLDWLSISEILKGFLWPVNKNFHILYYCFVFLMNEYKYLDKIIFLFFCFPFFFHCNNKA
jgi:hypothetical protein